MLRLMESATTLLTDESASSGRRRVCAVQALQLCQSKGACSLWLKLAEPSEGRFQHGVRHMPLQVHAKDNCIKQA